MDIRYKFLVEDNIDKIKENVSITNIKDKLYGLHLIDRYQHKSFEKVTNEDSLNILFNIFSQHDNAGKKFKDFVEDILQPDYNWLYKDLQKILTDKEWIQNKYKSILNFGDFPRKPAHYVERFEKIRQVQDCLKKLATVGKVVLCGMTGSGKSSLVLGVMTKEMVFDVFAGKVFWITVGDVDDEQILILLSKFYLKLWDDNSQENINFFSSKDILKDKLKKKIRENSNNNYMLLVLDNVCHESVVDAFDIGCKMLITTQNKDIWKHDSDSELIEIDGSFKIEETFTLFAKCLGKSVDYVKRIPEARKIHDLCRGHPFSIALFGSQIVTYKEILLHNESNKWKDFVGMLQKNYRNQQNTVITSCIESLDEELRKKYSDFAVFLEDVNVSSKVLEIMWELDEFKVIEIMKQLENKSLIVSYYNNHQHKYVFGIHVVLLTYLKNKYANELKEKHVRLILAYKRSCNDDFSRLNNDNYIYQYIGYHLKQADFIKDFKIYFDLKFIGAKIKATGIGDILKDFHIYKKEIQEQTIGNDKSIVKEIETFIKKFGDDLYKHEDINIIQCALKYAKNSFIHKTAMDIASSTISSLYFKIQMLPKNCDNYVSQFVLPENCTFVCFAKDDNHLLLGTKEGVIELWDRRYVKVLYKFVGHTQHIKYIELDPDGSKFLSVSDDGYVNIWTLPINNINAIPSLIQSDHKTFFGEENTIKPNYTLKPEDNDYFVSASFSNSYAHDHLIVIGSRKAAVILWNNHDRRTLNLNQNSQIQTMKFSDDDSLIIGACGTELFLFRTNFDGELFRSLPEPIIAILILEGNSFITLSKSYVSLWRFASKIMPQDRIPDLEKHIIYATETTECICAFLDYKNLYIVTNDYTINLYDIETRRNINTLILDMDYATAADVYQFSSKGSLFFLRYKNNILKFYTSHTAIENSHSHTPIFDCYWLETQVRLGNVAADNSIQIYNNFNVLTDINDLFNTVMVLCFSHCGNLFTYGMEDGKVFEYEIKTNHNRHIMQLPSSVSYLRYYGMNNILVASGIRGDLMVRYNGQNKCLITHSSISKIMPEPVIEVFYIESMDSLLTISKDRIIKLWSLVDGNMNVLKGPKQSTVTHTVRMSAMSKDEKLLVLTMGHMFDLFVIRKYENKFELVDFGGAELEHDLFSCSFSHDCKYLALGSEDGAIIIYNLNLNTEKIYKYTILNSHTSVVKCIKFSPNNHSLLVSVGEQIVWWNLNKVPKHSITRNRRSRQNRPNHNELVTSTENLTISHKMNSKIGSEYKPHLLQAVKLKGSYANAISVSPNFKSFVTKDDKDVCYIMEMIE